jgi:hypothetical protein
VSGWLVAGAIVGFLILGFVTRRALLALVPVLAFIVFGAAMLNDDLYARVSEDAQVGIYFVLAFGAIMTLAGAAGRRAADAGRRSRK